VQSVVAAWEVAFVEKKNSGARVAMIASREIHPDFMG
jgi:hypothetical protein